MSQKVTEEKDVWEKDGRKRRWGRNEWTIKEKKKNQVTKMRRVNGLGFRLDLDLDLDLYMKEEEYWLIDRVSE